MRFRRNKPNAPEQSFPPVHTIPGQPRRHARTGDTRPLPPPAPPAEALILAEPVRAWLADDLARMEAAADERHTSAERKRTEYEQDLADEAHWRTVAAGIRRLLDLAEATAQRGEQRAETALEQAPQAPANVPAFASTWHLPDPAPETDCGCRWERGESCPSCDALTPASILPWQPQPAADTSWWSGVSSTRDGQTETLQAVDGAAR